MKSITYGIILLLSVSVFSQEKFNSVDKKILGDLVNQFDVVVKKYYPNNQQPYKAYLSDLMLKKVNPSIIRDKKAKELFSLLKKSSTFKKIWKSVDKDNQYKIDYNGVYYNHLIYEFKNEKVKNSLQEFKQLQNMNPSNYILVGALEGYLKNDDYSLEVTKLAISIMFYYDIILEFNK